MNRKKLLIISLLILSFLLLIAGLYLLFRQRCLVNSPEFLPLEKFLVKNTCNQAHYKFEGLMYNIKTSDEELEFDFNAIDPSSRQSYYIENLKASMNQLDKPDILNTVSYVAPVSVEIIINKGNGLTNSNNTKWAIQKINNDSYLEILTFKKLYFSLTQESFKANVTKLQSLIPVLSSLTEKDGKFEIRTIGLNDLSSLHRVDTYLLGETLKNPHSIKFQDAKEIDLTNYVSNLEKYYKTNLDPSSENKNTDTLTNKQYYFGGCSLLKQIFEYNNFPPKARESFLKHYCPRDVLEEIITNLPQQNFSYTWADLNNQFDLSELSSQNESNIERPNLFLLSDLFAFLDLYKITDIDISNLENSARLFLTNILLSNGDVYFKDLCSIVYSENIIDKVISSRVNIGEIISNDINQFLKHSESDSMSSLQCLDSIENPDLQEELIEAMIYKFVKNYFFSEDKLNGIWINNKFDVKTNSLFFNLLFNYYRATIEN